MRSFFRCILLLLVGIFFVNSPRIAFASEYFTTKYDVTYAISGNEKTTVTTEIVLTNTTDDYFAGSYSLQLGFENIENISAFDTLGVIKPQVIKTKDGNSIDIPFNRRVIGKGNAVDFTLKFDTTDVAKKHGSVWEINIPKIPKNNDFSTFTARVTVPKSFGKPIYMKPQHPGSELVFNKEQLEESGISMGFGERQVYDFTLYYHLKNKHLFPIRTEIAVPPATNYQDIQLEAMTPKPYKMRKDEDGNWLAEYRLDPTENVTVTVQGKAIISLFPKTEEITKQQIDEYTKEKPYWQVSDAKIQTLAKTLKTPHAIYEYVVKNLTYDFSRVTEQKGRAGALLALQEPTSAVCLEFTDLFISIARAAGIPSREIEGYAYTDNPKQRPLSLVKDILHAWPEYYDFEKKTWIMIDPTWGNSTGGTDYFTQLDFDHLTFVRKGVSSEMPIPPSGYKYENDPDSKDVHVSFASSYAQAAPAIQVESIIDNAYLSGLPIKGKIILRNAGKTISLPQQVLIESQDLLPKRQLITSESILPFSFVEIPIAFQKKPLLTNTSATFTMSFDKTAIHKTIRITPFLINEWTIAGGITFGIAAIIVCIIAVRAWRVLLSQRKRSNPLRGEGKGS
ncbi:MAG: transglutaminase domain-containing protein [Candidatus Levybacteria bacterium]|nr:transglutaminase domain-containing protein [Candidatus Levybacteria bacterium]